MRPLCVLLLVGCTTESAPHLTQTVPLAVGWHQKLAATRSSCTQIDKHTDCETEGLDIKSVTVGHPDAFRTTVDDYLITIEALAPATSTIEVVVSVDGDRTTRTDTLIAAIPDGVRLELDCEHGTFPAGSGIKGRLQILGTVDGKQRVIKADPMFRPLESNVLTLGSGAAPDVTFGAPATPGDGVITTPLDPTWSLPVTIYDRTQVAIAIDGTTTALTTGASALFTLRQVLAAERATCSLFPMTAKTLTPTICRLANGTSLGAEMLAVKETLQIRTFAAGTCNFEITVDGTTTTATRTLAVN